MKTANKHKICKSQWNKWDEKTRRTFNLTFEMLEDQMFLLGQNKIDKKLYEVIRWNVSFLLASSENVERKLRNDWLKRIISHMENPEVKKIITLIRENI